MPATVIRLIPVIRIIEKISFESYRQSLIRRYGGSSSFVPNTHAVRFAQ
jgi:hypothetical protein